MAALRPQKTLADYVAIAFCPVLIMALVGSLMFFLIEVLYAGPHDDRLRWAVSAFVVGVVLIARISMMSEIAPRAGLYGIILAIVAGLVVNKYIEYPQTNPLAPIGWLVNLAIMALIWWSAHRLTWDCTLIDDEADASGQGLLEAAGLEKKSLHSSAKVKTEEPPLPPAPGEVDEANDPALTWWERWQARRNRKPKGGHTPGIWIVYYSLAALPLFGLGQMMVPAGEAARRKYAFWLLAIYVAAGLGLLLATSFLGLRRYLRQRKLQMPAAMTGAWFAIGGGFVAALLALAFLLPRPSPEYYNVVNVLTGTQKDSTRADVLGGKGSTKGQGPQTGKGASKQPGGSTPGKGQGGQGKKGDSSGSSKDGSKQGSNSKGGQQSGNSKDGQSKDSKQGDAANDPAGKDVSKDPSGQGKKPSKNGDSKIDQSQKSEGDSGEPGDEGKKEQRGDNQGRKDQRGEKSEEEKRREEESNSGSDDSTPPPDTPEAPELDDTLQTVVKWAFFGLLALVGAYVLVRRWRQILAMLQGLWEALLELWARLLGGWRRRAAADDEGLAEPGPQPPPPFASFSNPFLDGTTDARSVNYVTRYTFRALESWAYERGMGRQPEDTPLEFTHRLAEELPYLAANTRKLGDSYSRVCYARATLARPALDPLQGLWQKLTAPVRAAVAARQ